MLKKIRKNKHVHKVLDVLKKNKSTVLTIILLSIFADILFIPKSSDIRIFSILALSVVSILFYKLHARLIFILCLILLIVMFIAFVFSGTSETTEKTAVWFVLFFAVGIVRQWKE